MRIEDDIKLDFDDVLIRPKRSTLRSRQDVDLTRTYTFKHSERDWTGVPIMAANMDTVGTMAMATALAKENMLTCLHKFYTLEEWIEAYDDAAIPYWQSIPSIGANEHDWNQYAKFYAKFRNKSYEDNDVFPFVCIDVANGYGEYFVEFISKFRETFPDRTIIAGNVVTGEMAEQLILSGADIVKVGIGPGSACTTRLKTGVGYPQLSAVIECADAAHGLGAHVISDGGCRTPGDIAKAFGGGADFVMLGGMLAGHDESGGELIKYSWTNNEYDIETGELIKYEKKYKRFYGMSSDTAQKAHYGEQKEYRASEGRTVKVPYRGSVENTVQEILGGIRSTCTYVGAPTLKQLSKCTTFIKVNNTHNRVFVDKEI